MRLHYIQHVPFEDPANILAWAGERGHAVSRTSIPDGDSFPDPASFDLLVVMGGPMSVTEKLQFPWIVREKQFVRQALDAGRAILGVCLGAQLLAEVLGGVVSRNPDKEIGWHPVRMTDAGLAIPAFKEFPREFDAFHWHGETFSLPPGATRVASSDACQNQAFAMGPKVVGLQFHIETSDKSLAALIDNCCAELVPGPYIQSPADMTASPARLAAIRAILFGFLDRLVTAA